MTGAIQRTMAAAGAEGKTMRRRPGEPAERTREGARSGLPSFTLASHAHASGGPNYATGARNDADYAGRGVNARV